MHPAEPDAWGNLIKEDVMKKALIAGLATAAFLLVPLAASAQSGGDAGSANKNVGSAATAPNNQSGSTDSRATGATAPAPGRSSGGAMTTTAAPGSSVVISADQRTRIRNYVTERKIRPVAVKERIAVGATLPAEVELEAVPADWGPEVSTYRYVYSDDHVVLVEPSSRRVVQVID